MVFTDGKLKLSGTQVAVSRQGLPDLSHDFEGVGHRKGDLDRLDAAVHQRPRHLDELGAVGRAHHRHNTAVENLPQLLFLAHGPYQ